MSSTSSDPPTRAHLMPQLRAQWWWQAHGAGRFAYGYGAALLILLALGLLALQEEATTASCTFGTGALLAGVLLWSTLHTQASHARNGFGFRCPACGKMILSRVEWVCGFCDARNDGGRWDLFHECGTCHTRAPAFTCYHCGECIALDADGDVQHCAIRYLPPEPVATVEEQETLRRTRESQEHADALDKARREKELLTAKVEKTLVERQLSKLTAPPAAPAAVADKQQQAHQQKVAQIRTAFTNGLDLMAVGQQMEAELKSNAAYQNANSEDQEAMLENLRETIRTEINGLGDDRLPL